MTTPDGITLLGLILLFAAVFCLVEYRDWQNRDEDRRIERLRKRNLA